MFTGDRSATFLLSAMYHAGLATKPDSISSRDGLELNGAYLTAAARCAPPGNRLLRSELDNCNDYLSNELELLRKWRCVIALGSVAFGALARLYGLKARQFSHGQQFDLPGSRLLISCYHPSPQNTNRGLLTKDMLIEILSRAKSLGEKPAPVPSRTPN
jgi:uracil-DNA glycosylase family 4